MQRIVTSTACCGLQAPCEGCEAHDLAVCAALSREQLATVAPLVRSRTLRPGAVLFHEGHGAEHVFTVTGGVLKLYKLFDGQRQVTGFATISDFLRLACNDVYVYSAEAVGDARVCRFDRRRFAAALERFPAMERALLERTSNELAAAQEQMPLLGRKTARERLASFLVGLARRPRGLSHGLVPLPMSRADIADYLGLTVETVSRTLTALRRERLIGMPNKHVVQILDPDALDRLGNG